MTRRLVTIIGFTAMLAACAPQPAPPPPPSTPVPCDKTALIDGTQRLEIRDHQRICVA